MNNHSLYTKEDLDFLKDLPPEDCQRFWNMSEEEQHRCISEFKLSEQDDAMWAENEGISQLEGRIATKSFQG